MSLWRNLGPFFFTTLLRFIEVCEHSFLKGSVVNFDYVLLRIFLNRSGMGFLLSLGWLSCHMTHTGLPEVLCLVSSKHGSVLVSSVHFFQKSARLFRCSFVNLSRASMFFLGRRVFFFLETLPNTSSVLSWPFDGHSCNVPAMFSQCSGNIPAMFL